MKKFVLRPLVAATTLAVAGQAAAVISEPADVDLGNGLKFTPTLDTKLKHDDNIYSTKNNKKSSEIFETTANFDLWTETGKDKYRAGVKIKDARYFSSHSDDHTDWDVNGDLHKEFGSRHRLDLNAGYGKVTEDRSSNGIDLNEYDHTRVGATYGFGSEQAIMHFDLFGKYDKKEYEKNVSNGFEVGRVKDSKQKTYGGTAYYRLAPKTDALLELKRINMDYDRRINNQSQSFDVDGALVGLKWESTAKTTGYAKFGVQKHDSNAGKDDTRSSWEVGVSYQPRTYSLFQLVTERSYGLESENADFTKYTATTGSWTHDWSSKWQTEFQVSYRDEDLIDNQNTTLKNRKSWDYGAKLNWQVRRWATLSVGYTYTDRDATAKAQALNNTDEYNKNVVYVSASFSL